MDERERSAALLEIMRVGPKGYIHGWIFTGAPGVGAHVFHSHHGHGTVTAHSDTHATVKFDSGAEHSFEARPGKGPARLESPDGKVAIPDLAAGLPPVPSGPGRYSGSDFNKAGMTGHLEALDRRDALHSANKAAELQKSGGSHQEIMTALAAAEERAPAKDRAYHAARLDAYANAHGLKGWYRHQSSAGGGTHMVQVSKIRTPEEGDRGRYYASDPFGHGTPQIIDRDTGKIVGKAANAKAAEARIKELESRNPPLESRNPPKVSRAAAQRASDLKYGHGSALWAYWTRGEGFAKWSGAAHKWTTLHALLLKAGVPAHSADGLTTNIITAVMPGYMKLAHAKGHKAGRSEVETTQRAEMTSASINDLPDSEFAYIEAGGKKDASGKTIPRSLRHFPVHDAAHVRNALARAPQSPHGPRAMSKIRQAAKRLGVEVSADTSTKPAASRGQAEYMRLYPLEDMHIIRSADGGDGRTVEAFAAVFDDPAEIMDHEGHYVEVIERSAFNKVLADVTRARGGLPGSVKVLYNHGMTIQGTPSERFSMPIGVPVDIRAEARGLLTRTRYNDTPLAEEILENIRAGSITSQSFTGRIVRSDPALRRGDRHRPDSTGNLRTVRRTELGLREYGPVLWPAYSGAEILGVRMSTPGTLDEDDLEPGTPQEDEALPPDGEAAADEPQPLEESHSQRYHQHALYVLRSSKLREEAGLVW